MKLFYFILLLLMSSLGNAQDYVIERIKVEDFEEKRYALDTTAAAVIDYQIGTTYYEVAGRNFNIITEVKTRVKIFTKDGYKHATVQIPLYRDRATRELLTVSNASTYNLVDGKIERTRMKNDGEFLEKIEGNHYLATFTLPNVKEGSIIEYTTKVSSPYISYVPDWHFQYDIPVKVSEFTFRPDKNLDFYKYIRGGETIRQMTVGDEYKYKASNVPALKNEGYVDNINNYRSSVLHTLSSYKTRIGSERVAGNWEDVVKNIYDDEKFGNQLKKTDYVNDIVQQLTANLTTSEEKEKAIHEYVRDNFTWNRQLDVLTEGNLSNVFKNKVGNSAEINLLTVAMMRAANLKAHPIILATREKGITYMPSRTAFNNVIVGVEHFDKVNLYDATNKFTSKNILPIANLNWIGRMVRANGTSNDVILEPQHKSLNRVFATLNLDTDNGSINGSVRRVLNQYEAYLYRNQFHDRSEEKHFEYLEDKYKMDVDSLAIKNMNDINENIEEYYTFNKEAAFDKIGDKIYVKPAFIFTNSENPFKLEQRTFPIDFIYPNDNNYSVTINIPEGYEIDYLPKSKAVETETKSVTTRWTIHSDDKKVLVRWNITFNKAYISGNEYQNIKMIFNELINFMDERIVFRKI